MRQQDGVVRLAPNLNAQDVLCVAEILEAELAMEVVLDASELVPVWTDEEKIVDVECDVAERAVLVTNIDARVGAGRL